MSLQDTKKGEVDQEYTVFRAGYRVALAHDETEVGLGWGGTELIASDTDTVVKG